MRDRSDDGGERRWTHLTVEQADGQACVMCELPPGPNNRATIPVGRSHTGSKVLACLGRCADDAAITFETLGDDPTN